MRWIDLAVSQSSVALMISPTRLYNFCMIRHSEYNRPWFFIKVRFEPMHEHVFHSMTFCQTMFLYKYNVQTRQKLINYRVWFLYTCRYAMNSDGFCDICGIHSTRSSVGICGYSKLRLPMLHSCQSYCQMHDIICTIFMHCQNFYILFISCHSNWRIWLYISKF